MAKENYKGAILAQDLSDTIRPVAQKWAEALNATVAVMYDHGTSAEDRATLQLLAMQTVAAFFAPFEPTMVERQNMSAHFLLQLNAMCDQYFEDKVAAGAVR